MDISIEKILEPFPVVGLHEGISEDIYHKWGGASFSRLSILDGQTPAHLLESILNPKPATPAMKLGRFYHAAVLQPEEFEKYYASKGDIDRRTKEGKAAWDRLLELYPEDRILGAREFDGCLRVRDAIYRHSVASQIIKASLTKEVSFAYIDEQTGMPCRGRVDAFCSPLNATVDIKGTTSASPTDFIRAIFDYGYYVQGAHYVDSMSLLGAIATDHLIIAIEKTSPYAIAIYRLTNKTLELGRRKFRSLLNQFAECVKTKSFPGYPSQINDIELDDWMVKRAEQGLLSKQDEL